MSDVKMSQTVTKSQVWLNVSNCHNVSSLVAVEILRRTRMGLKIINMRTDREEVMKKNVENETEERQNETLNEMLEAEFTKGWNAALDEVVRQYINQTPPPMEPLQALLKQWLTGIRK